MKQMLDTAAPPPPVFPFDCAGDDCGCADRRPEDTAEVLTSRVILRSARNSNVRRRAAAPRTAASIAAYAESGRARCSRGAFRCQDGT
jgi:hypothetical protein